MVMDRLGRRLNPRPLMMVSSVLLNALAVSMVGQGVHALQAGGYVSSTDSSATQPDSAVTAIGLGFSLLPAVLVGLTSWLGRNKKA